MRTRAQAAAAALTLASFPDDIFLQVIAAFSDTGSDDLPLSWAVRALLQQLHRLRPIVGVQSLAVVQRPAHGPWHGQADGGSSGASAAGARALDRYAGQDAGPCGGEARGPVPAWPGLLAARARSVVCEAERHIGRSGRRRPWRRRWRGWRGCGGTRCGAGSRNTLMTRWWRQRTSRRSMGRRRAGRALALPTRAGGPAQGPRRGGEPRRRQGGGEAAR